MLQPWLPVLQLPSSGRTTRAVDFYDVKSDLEALLAPARAELFPVSTRLCIRGAVLGGWAEKRSVWSARSTRPGCSAMSSAVRLGIRAAHGCAACLTPGCRRTGDLPAARGCQGSGADN